MKAIAIVSISQSRSFRRMVLMLLNQVVVPRQLNRRYVLTFSQKLPPHLCIEKRSSGTSGMQSSPYPQGRQPTALEPDQP